MVTYCVDIYKYRNMKRLLFIALTLLFPLIVIAGGEVDPPGTNEFQKGEKYFHGYYGTKVNYTKALKWYRKAAELGHKTAQCQLGIMYENGNGVAKDLNEAEKWYKRKKPSFKSLRTIIIPPKLELRNSLSLRR